MENCEKNRNFADLGYVLHKYIYAVGDRCHIKRVVIDKMTKQMGKIRQNVKKTGDVTVFIKIDNQKKLCNNLVSIRSKSF